MKPIVLTSAAAIAIVMAGPIPAARAQIPYVQLASPADQLASEMRILASNPLDVPALLRAGELTLRLDDPTAASGFFARAERIDPNNPRIKAGKAIILLRAGRPGEALRRFVEAEQARGDVRTFAADRGLAYDLIGEQDRAQRDYRLALKSGSLNAVGIDETTRRYALSLGISGKRDEALAQIDPLLRKSDRGAWRARAFILAMTGDGRGAEKIAASMMPGGLGQGLQPFFEKLPTLRPADRAFAVHFGEVRSTPMRLVDARMAPVLPALAPDPEAPVAIAAVTQRPSDTANASGKKEKKRRGKRDKIDVAIAQAAPVPLPPPPTYQAPAVATVQPLPSYRQAYVAPVRTAPSSTSPTSGNSPVALASNRGSLPSALPVPRRETTTPYRETTQSNRAAAESDVRVASTASDRGIAPLARVQSQLQAQRQVQPLPQRPAQATTSENDTDPYEPIAGGAAGVSGSAVISAAPATARQSGVAAVPRVETPTARTEYRVASGTAITAPTSGSAATSMTAPSSSSSSSSVAASPSPSIAASAASTRPLPPVPGPVKGEDTILAAIIANITVPGSELDVSTPQPQLVADAPVQVAETASSRAVTSAPARPEPDPAPDLAAVRARAALATEKAAAEKSARNRAVADKVAAEKTAADMAALDKLGTDKLAADKKAADKKLADKKLADKKLADKKIADAKKLADAKKAEELKKKNDPKLLEPSRIWVQVAGGANEGDLPKEWAKVREKAPAAFKGKSGWMTPLRATNRVLTGPFKTDAEARTFVNMLAKEGISGFAFTSDAGQKVTRLGGK